jgi:hypothetical protein
MPETPTSVTADDLLAAARLAVGVIEAGAEADWAAPAGDLAWDCWETVEHLADDFWWYAALLAADDPSEELAFAHIPKRPDGPNDLLRVVREEGAVRLAKVVWAEAVVHATVVRAAPTTARAWHPMGAADAEASAAMGVVEALAHTHDVALGLGVPFEGDADLAAKVLHRLMPDVERTGDAWVDFLWATGRLDTTERPRRSRWRWFNEPPEPPEAG